MSDRLRRLSKAHLYLVCADQPDEFLHAAIRGGVDIVQLRMKDAPSEALIRTARRFATLCAAHGVLFILNDRPDLVADANADGAHVGQDDISVSEARGLVGPDRLIGLSTHSPEQIDAARHADVDYIGVGPVHATPTKPGRPAVGLDLVNYAAKNARTPFFAIGGIDPTNAAAVAHAGAHRIAVVRALTEAPDPARAAAELKRTIVEERQPVGAAQP